MTIMEIRGAIGNFATRLYSMNARLAVIDIGKTSEGIELSQSQLDDLLATVKSDYAAGS